MPELPTSEVPVTTAATFCATLVDEWVRCGVSDAVVSPGSRSTPLALALAADERVRVHVHHDERSGGFMALGLGLATGRPALVLTTSGTAAVELHPAVVEAHHSRVPLLCCTADRPPELHQVGAAQTIDQARLYGTSTRWFADPGVPDASTAASWRSLAARAFAEATGRPPGPVQLNLPFDEPLVGAAGELPAGRPDGRAWHQSLSGDPVVPEQALEELADLVSGKLGVIVAGAPRGGRTLDGRAVHELARALGVPVIADPRSGCRLPEGSTVSHADLLLRNERFAAAHVPEFVIQLGDLPASKVLAQWLGRSEASLILVDADGVWSDPARRADRHLGADPDVFAIALADVARAVGVRHVEGWVEDWASADAIAADQVARVLALHPEPTEPAIARDLVEALPDGATLVVSSSMPVRDVEWYSAPRRGARIISNRGANGIDGVVSTAVGVAVAGGPTALLVGDVAFLHDTNALLGLAAREVDLVIVVVDNDGGGIFSFLPQAALLDAARFEVLFGTPHGVDLAGLAKAHGLSAEVVGHQAKLRPRLDRAFDKGGLHLLVARTDRAGNAELHAELNSVIVAALDAPAR